MDRDRRPSIVGTRRQTKATYWAPSVSPVLCYDPEICGVTGLCLYDDAEKEHTCCRQSRCTDALCMAHTQSTAETQESRRLFGAMGYTQTRSRFALLSTYGGVRTEYGLLRIHQ